MRWSTDIAGRSRTRATGSPCRSRCNASYCGSRFGRISVFDLADGAPLPAEEIGPLYGEVGTIDVSADGATLMAISGSQPIISRWQLEGVGLGRRLVAPRPHAGGTVFVRGLVRRDGTPGASDRRRRPRRIYGGVVEGVVVMDTATGDVDVSVRRGGERRRLGTRPTAVSRVRTRTGCSASSTRTPGNRSGSRSWASTTLWPSIDGDDDSTR